MASPLHFPGMTYLKGPYPVSFTDLPANNNYKDIWTPSIGDILLGVWVDFNTVIQGQANGSPFSSAGLQLGTSATSDFFASGQTYDFISFRMSVPTLLLPSVITTVNTIRLTYKDFGEGNMTAGYGVFYALVAKSPQQ